MIQKYLTKYATIKDYDKWYQLVMVCMYMSSCLFLKEGYKCIDTSFDEGVILIKRQYIISFRQEHVLSCMCFSLH